MKLVKPSQGLILEFKAVVAQLPRAEPRKMFGYDAAFVNGNMAVGLWQDTCVLKLSAQHQAELLQAGHAKPFAPAKGRAMSAWLELSAELAHDPEELLVWSRRAIEYTATLPPKVPKAAKVKTKATPSQGREPKPKGSRSKTASAKRSKTDAAKSPRRLRAKASSA
ncbi:MAG TPA: TfoX/Sxy family protein, partial [Polyangiaceae bacterium]|nr:TfoX/Sxy family protein [Polyangiaceae bacterium]